MHLIFTQVNLFAGITYVLPISFCRRVSKIMNLLDVYDNVYDLPKQIRLEACSTCQLDCPACYMRRAYKDDSSHSLKKMGYLKFENFKKLLTIFNFQKLNFPILEKSF